MKKALLFILCAMFAGLTFGQTYVGPEKCLTCHNNAALGDMTGWRQTMHANGYSVVLDSKNTMVNKDGIVADMDNNGVDDFIDGLDMNTVSTAFDVYKPNAPKLAYSDTDGYTITIGELTYKVYLTYGGSGLYKQRYAVKIPASDGTTKSVYISPIQYNEKTHEYVLYHADAWYDATTHEPLYNSTTTLAEVVTNSRNLAKGCAGCHTTGLKITQDTNGEWLSEGATVEDEALYAGKVNVFDMNGDGALEQINTTCERCHGAGGDHASTGDKTKIINPRDLTTEQANNLCGMCHSRGHSKPNGTFGYPYNDDALTGWTTGDLVSDIYEPADGFWGDGVTSKKHHQQFTDFYNSVKPTFEFHKVACYECHDVHNTVKHQMRTEIVEEDSLGDPITIPTDVDNNSLCLACHATHGDFADISKEMVADLANNETAIGAIVSKHSNHIYDPEGTSGLTASRCSKCHMPKGAKSAVAYDIHNHTFEPIAPAKTKEFNMPNSCAVSCHAKAGYPQFGITMTTADFTDWAGANQQELADSLGTYYGPGGKWWDTTVSVHLQDLETPATYQLAQNYPNPFNPTTTINFSVPAQGHVTLNVFDAVGQLVTTLVDNEMSAGNYAKIFNATNLSSGVYFYRLESNNFVQVKKMLLVK